MFFRTFCKILQRLFHNFAQTSYRITLKDTMMTKVINGIFNSILGKWRIADEQKSNATVLVLQEKSTADKRNYRLIRILSNFFTITEMMIMYDQSYEILLFLDNKDFVKHTTVAY